MGGGFTRTIEVGTDTCFLGQNAGKQYIDSAAFDASTLDAGTGIDAVQTVTVTGGPTGGTFTLSYDGSTTSALAFNAGTGAVQTALEGLANVDAGDIVVSGSTGGPYTLHFGKDLGSQDVPAVTATPSLTGGTNPGVQIIVTRKGSQSGGDPRILVGSADFPGTIVEKVPGTGGKPDKVKEFDGTGTIFGIVDGVEEFVTNDSRGDRDVAVYNHVGLVVDARKVHNYQLFKAAIDTWAASRSITIKHGS